MPLEPYHVFDPLLARTPFPWRPSFDVAPVAETGGELTTVRMARRYAGGELLGVQCYLVGDTLVDTGLACYGREMVELSRARGVRRAVVTHHHEDHAGNAAALTAAGLAVESSGPCRDILACDLPIRFYEHLAWGKMPPAAVDTLPAATRIGRYAAQVVPAPGHCHDQVVFHVPERGWLFSGDAFIHERVRIFRRDEDFAATIGTLRRLLTLDFDTLLCAHRPRYTGGKAALAQKLEWLLHLEGEVRRLHAQGVGVREIARRVDIAVSRPGALAFAWLTVGDATPENVVRSILGGPRLRREIERHIVIR